MSTGQYEIDENVVSHFSLRELTEQEVSDKHLAKSENEYMDIKEKLKGRTELLHSTKNSVDNDVIIDDFFDCVFCGKTNKKTIEMIDALQFLIKDGLNAVIDAHCSHCKAELAVSSE